MAQVNGAVTILSDRYANQVILTQSSTDLDGDQSISLNLPAGLGQVLISELVITLTGPFATIAASLFEMGAAAFIVSPAGPLADFIGNAEWEILAGTFAAPTRFQAQLRPETPVLWRENEQLRLIYAEPDTNVAPTADGSLMLRCLRLISGAPEMPTEFLLTS